MSRSAGAGALGVVLVCLSGCAAHRPETLTDRFVNRASSKSSTEATFDAPGGDAHPAPSPAVLPPAVLAGPTPKSSDLPTVETENKMLADALVRLKADPSVAHARAVAAIYARLGVYDRAIDQLNFALKRDPKNAAVEDDFARAWRDAGIPVFALPHASRAVYFAPASAEAHNTLGTVLFALGSVDDALAEFGRALALDPAATYARDNICRIATARGDRAREASACIAPGAVAAAPGDAARPATPARAGDDAVGVK